MSVYVVKEKGSSPTRFICSSPSLENALRLLKGLERADREARTYKRGRYVILQREYCPTFSEACPNYMIGICSLRDPSGCDEWQQS